MTILRETIIVPRSAADCYRYLLDFSSIEQWDPGVYRAKKISPGAVEQGSRFALTLNLSGIESPMEYELLDAIKNQKLLLKGSASAFTALDTISFEQSGDNTLITYEADIQFASPYDLASPVMGPVLKRVGKAAVQGLKTALTLQEKADATTWREQTADKLLLPGAFNFTRRGYLKMANKGLSEFMDGKTVAITGPTSGLGLAAAAEFARLGANLLLIGRNPEKLRAATEQIIQFSGCPEQRIQQLEADLSSISSCRKLAAALRDSAPQLDVLVNNAGALFESREETAEGYERALAVNLLGPYVLIESLIEHICNCQTHVINVVSGGMYLQGLALGDMNYLKGSYDGSKAYARAKRGLVALTEYWAETYGDSGARFNSMHPGWADTPGVESSLPAFHQKMQRLLRDSRMGADTIVWLASSTAAANESGGLWFDRKRRETALLPGTAVSHKKRRSLLSWLESAASGGEESSAGKVA